MKLKFEYLHEEYHVEAEKIGSAVWIHFQGETFVVEPKVTRRGQKAAEEGVALAPMPGKVTKIMAAPGDKVTAGQIVVVMEAMKMEYSLKSSGPGQLKEIHCQVGDQVTLGQKLFEVSKDNS